MDGMQALVRQLDGVCAELGRQQSRLAEVLASTYLDTWPARCVDAHARWIASRRPELLRRIEAAKEAGAPLRGILRVDVSALPAWAAAGVPPLAGDGQALAREVGSALDGRASPAVLRSALAQLRPVTDRARAGVRLTASEVEFLRAFYAELGGRVLEIGPYVTRSRLTWLGVPRVGATGKATGLYTGGGTAPGYAAAERAWMLGAVGDGLLALSNERNPGGGWGSVPPRTRAALLVAMADVPRLVCGPGVIATRRGRGETSVLGGARSAALGQLMRASLAQGGVVFSSRLMSSAVAYARGLESVDRELKRLASMRGVDGYGLLQFDRADRRALARLSGVHEVAMLNAGSRNHAASQSLLVGEGRRAFLESLVSHRWPDDGAAAGQVVDWLGAASVQGDPAGGVVAADARRAYYWVMQVVTDAGFFATANRAMIENPAVSVALARASKGNIGLFATVVSDPDSSWHRERAGVANDDALRMLMLAQAGAEGRREINLAAEAYKFDLLHAARTGAALPGADAALTLDEAGRRAGTLDGLATAAAENAIWARHIDEADARNVELQAAFRDKVQVATAVKNLTAGALSGVPVAGWALATVASTTGDAIILDYQPPDEVRPRALPDEVRAGSLLPPNAAAERAAYDIAAYAHARGEHVSADAFVVGSDGRPLMDSRGVPMIADWTTAND